MRAIILLCLWTAIFAFTLTGSSLAQDYSSDGINKLITMLNSDDIDKRTEAAIIVTRAIIDSPDLYTTIETSLKNGYNSSKDSKHIDEMSWLCKALAASGDSEYLELLEEVASNADSKKLQKYARQSAGQIDEYARRQNEIKKTASFDKNLSEVENKYISMLNTGDPAIVRDAAQYIYRSDKKINEAVYQAVDKRIHLMMPSKEDASPAPPSWFYTDTVAWLCKALSASGNPQYVSTLEGVLSSTNNTSLQGHVRKALKELQQ